jgi:hypothetical protein
MAFLLTDQAYHPGLFETFTNKEMTKITLGPEGTVIQILPERRVTPKGISQLNEQYHQPTNKIKKMNLYNT